MASFQKPINSINSVQFNFSLCVRTSNQTSFLIGASGNSHYFSVHLQVPGEHWGRSYRFAILNLEHSDSGIYYCAVWDKHVGSDFLYTALEILLVAAKCSSGNNPCLTSSPRFSLLWTKRKPELNAHFWSFIFYSHLLPLHNSHSFSWKQTFIPRL